MSPEPMGSCECGGEGFARFSVVVETVGPRPDWLPNNDRSTTVCIECARKAAGVRELGEAAKRAVEEVLAEDAGPKLAAVVADKPGRTIDPSHRELILAVERMPNDPSGRTVVRFARRAYDEPGAWGCILADCVRDIAKTMAGPGLLKHGESMTADQRTCAGRLLELFRGELLQMERLDPGDPYGPPTGPG